MKIKVILSIDSFDTFDDDFQDGDVFIYIAINRLSIIHSYNGIGKRIIPKLEEKGFYFKNISASHKWKISDESFFLLSCLVNDHGIYKFDTEIEC